MLCTGFSSLVIAALHLDDFLFIVGIFSIYLVATGQRYLGMKKNSLQPIAQPIDWILTVLMFVFALIFILYGSYKLMNTNSFGIVLLLFGLISLRMVYQDFKNYKGEAKELNFGLITHLQRMAAALIGATTAFLVVNNTLLPPILAWVLPSLVFSPLIAFWTNKRRIKA